ncbi:MAG: 4-hydroxy-3-methylbut-2-enyl diphosphate reductase [Mollicutes bacterium]|nr:4-hydroxy-3-methylbut-2-enyl diphosphate reductase [Mollicutes bacterium]
MEIKIAKYSGFCFGVKNTFEKALVLAEKQRVYCLGEIVHNQKVIDYLEKKGVIFVDNINSVPNGKTIIIRAHGTTVDIYNKIKAKKLNLVDLTCGKIVSIHHKVSKLKDTFIIIVGKKNHPEVISTKSFAGPNSFIIESEADINKSYELYKEKKLTKVFVVCQTTFSLELFDKITKKLKKLYKDIIIDNTICDATIKRQNEVESISKEVDIMLIVGDNKSSNTRELFNIASKNTKTYFISDKKDLKNIVLEGKIGIASGASTPQEEVTKIVKLIEKEK